MSEQEARERTDDDWVWRFGMRECEIGPDGGPVYAPRPLTREEFIHPREGDRLLASPLHTNTVRYLDGALQWLARDEVGTAIVSKVGLDFGVSGLRAMCPDLCLLRHLQRPLPRNECPVLLPPLGAVPALVIEVTDRLTRDVDLIDKLPLYHKGGVQHYLIVDHGPEGAPPDVNFLLHRWTPERFEPVAADSPGRVRLGPLNGWLAGDGNKVQAFEATAERIPTAQESYRRLEQVKQRIRELEAELARLRGAS